ncbi:UNVERIFIED_CONTAM: hypothetical protein GTU68_015614 [Idotea baltica]|nr:hypothetical protein [Idotea baltica]
MLSCKNDNVAIEEEFKTTEKVYELVWEDNFENSGKPDATKWIYETGFIRNEELQYFTDSLKNVRQEDGNLIIEAYKEKISNNDFVAVTISTEGLVSWKYGKIEVRAKLPRGLGQWPAIWMLGDNLRSVSWPKCGEIDIMEHVGYTRDSIYGTVHTEAYNHNKGTHIGKAVFIEDPYDAFHIYAIEWTEEKIDFLLDDQIYHSFSNENKTIDEWPFDQAFHIKLNASVGGTWGGIEGVDDTVFPQQMRIDYIHVYQKK